MRKILTFLFAALMSAGMWALTPLSGDTWDDDTKTLTVNSDPGFQAYANKTEIKHVIISSGVMSVGNYAFYGCSHLESVTIPNGVTSIGSRAFMDCSNLTSITIPSSVNNIGSDAFYNCTAVTDVYCYPNAADLTWDEDGEDDFKDNKATSCHVFASELTAYQTKFTGTVNVTFVGDLPAATVAVTGVTLDQNEAQMTVGGETLTLTATVNPNNATDQSVSWSTSDANVATVENGVVTAVAAGNATITVTTTDGAFTATCSVTVTAPEPAGNSITINESSHGSVVASSSSAAAGETITLTATPDDGYQLKSISGVYLPVPETLNYVSAQTTVTGTEFQCVGTMNANAYGWRVYNPGTAQTLTVSSLNGTTLIKKIEFTATMGPSRTNDMLSVSAGTLSFDGNTPSTTVTINDINATSVTISGSGTNSAKTWYINSVRVYTDEVELEISDTENANVKTFTMVNGEVTISAEFEPASTPEPAKYYIVGNMNEWAVDENYEMNLNIYAETEEYFYALDLTTTSEFKVVKMENGVQSWFPTGMGNNYGQNGEITEDAEYTIYFRPNYDGGEDWFYNCIYVSKNEPEPTPTVWTSLKVGDVIKLGDKIEVPAEGDGWGINGNILSNAWGPYTLIRANIVQEHEYDDPEVTEAEDGAYYVFKAENDGFYPLSNIAKGGGLVVTGTSDGLVVTDVGDLGIPVFTVAVHENGGTPTAVENVQTNPVQATKFFRNGMLLIEKNGVVYNVLGAQVK